MAVRTTVTNSALCRALVIHKKRFIEGTVGMRRTVIGLSMREIWRR